MITIDIKGSANKSLNKIDKKVKGKIQDLLSRVSALDSTSEIDHDGKLKGYQDRYKIRLGNYQIVYKIESLNHILITAIAHRKDIYNKLFGTILSI